MNKSSHLGNQFGGKLVREDRYEWLLVVHGEASPVGARLGPLGTAWGPRDTAGGGGRAGRSYQLTYLLGGCKLVREKCPPRTFVANLSELRTHFRVEIIREAATPAFGGI